jgi:uncharacterized membrane protein
VPPAAGKGRGSPARGRGPGKADHDRIVDAIRKAESATTGQICVHVSHDSVDAHVAVIPAFDEVGLAGTKERNAVLIFVAPKTRTFAVYGDAGVHERCGDDFWQSTVAGMEAHFRAGSVTAALVAGIERIGETLTEHFPRTPGSAVINELPDEPI